MVESKSNLMKVDEVAEMLRLSVHTVRNWLSLGKFRRVKIGRLTFVHRSDVEMFLQEALSDNQKSSR